MHDSPSYIVILSQPESYDLQKLADILAPFLSMPRMDVVMQLKRTWGLLHRTQDMNEAQNLQAELNQESIETFILDASEMKEAPSLKVLKEARVEREGLVFKEEDQEKSLSWDSFGLMCAGQVLAMTQVKKRTIGDAKVARRVAETGLTPLTALRISHARLKGKEVVEKKTSTSFLLDLIAADDSESIRILGESFNYSCLKERMGYNVPMNFKNLYTDISKLLPSVIKNQGAWAMEADDMAKMRYTDVSHYENEKRWLMQLVRGD
jgi:hypothetical protein